MHPYTYTHTHTHTLTKLIDLEDRCRRNNVRIYGISESKYETWEKCEEKVGEVFLEKQYSY